MKTHAWLGLLVVLSACGDDGGQVLVLDASAPDAHAATDAGHGDDGGDDAAAPREGLTLIARASAAPGMLFTVAVQTPEPDDRALALCRDADEEVATLRLYRGRGSVSLRLRELGDAALSVCGDERSKRLVRVEHRPIRELTGLLTAQDAHWDDTSDVRVTGDLTVPSGTTLVIGAGTRVRFGTHAAIVVEGALEVNGSSAHPTLFTAEPLGNATPPAWGGLIFRPGSRGTLEGAWFNLGGGDSSRKFGHSSSQAVIAAEGAEVALRRSGVVDNVGKAFGTLDSVLDLDDLLISRCDTGGQLNRTALTLRNSHVLEMPDADGQFDDDDNDGLYLSQPFSDAEGQLVESLIADTVFAVGEDDAIDHNGALVRIERTFIEGFRNEGLAASNENRVTIVDSVVRRCFHGIEAGYGSPEVIVERCFLTDNEHGLHVGDSYDWATDARMRVTHTVSVGNRESNAKNYVLSLMAPLPDGLEVRCSMVDEPDLDGRDGNLEAVATAEAWALACDPRLDRLDPSICGDVQLGPAHCF